MKSPNREHAEHLHRFSVELARAMRTGDTAALDAITARQRAAGYGGEAAPHIDAISAVQPRERPAGPWLHCPRCGAEQLAHQVAEHDARAADPEVWSLCRTRIVEMSLGAPDDARHLVELVEEEAA